MARNYFGLQVISVFDRVEYQTCRWSFSDQSRNYYFEIVSETSLPCEDRSPHPDYDLKCNEANNIINTTLIILLPLQIDATVRTECAENIISSSQIQASIDLQVTGKC